MAVSVGWRRGLGCASLVVLIALGVGCKARNAKAFWRNLAKESCRWGRTCETQAYRDTYFTNRECRNEDYDFNGHPRTFAAGCPDYDEDVGRACLKWYRSHRDGCTVASGTPSECDGICGPGSQIAFSRSRSFDLDGTPAEGLHVMSLTCEGLDEAAASEAEYASEAADEDEDADADADDDLEG